MNQVYNAFVKHSSPEHAATTNAMLENIGITSLPRPTHCFELADVLFKDLELKKLHYSASALHGVVVNPEDGRDYEVVIIPPKG